jgi:Tol biopolymer transport system component
VAPLGSPPADSIVWSPNRENQLLITATNPDHDNNEIYILDVDTMAKTILVHTDKGTLLGYGWSPDSQYALFLKTTGMLGDPSEVLIINLTDQTQIKLADNAVSATWSPDGVTIAYFTYASKRNNDLRDIFLHVKNVKTKEDRVIFNIESDNIFGMSWAPDGRRLIFSLGNINESNLYIIDINDLKTIQLTTSGQNRFPVWSPSGSEIAYQEYFSDGRESAFNLIKPDGSCKLNVLNSDSIWSPTWLPDGKRLGYIGSNGIYSLEIKKAVEGKQALRPCP